MPAQIAKVTPLVHPDGNCFVTVETEDGRYGVGEAGLTRRGPAVASVIEEFASDLVGADPARIEHHWQTMFRGGFFPGGVIQSAAVSAVDIALWDLKGKTLGVPVYELLGGRTRAEVECYSHVQTGDLEQLIANCEDRQEKGWDYVRWGLMDPTDGEVYDTDRAIEFCVEQAETVREHFGDELDICIDVHTRLDPPEAIEFCEAIEPYDPHFVEDPIRIENTEQLRRVREQTTVPIAVGEQFDSKWTFQQPIEEDLIDFCRVDLCIGGGLTEAQKIANWCETHYINLTPHNPGSLGPPATAAALHLCLSSPLQTLQELKAAPGTSFNDLFPEQVPFEDGCLQPPEEPGLGIEFDESTFEDLEPYQPSSAKGYDRPDGSYTNW